MRSSCKYPNQTIGKKHIVHLTGFGAYSSACLNEQTKMPAPWESISPHPLLSGQRHCIINLYNSIYAVDGLCLLSILHSVILNNDG